MRQQYKCRENRIDVSRLRRSASFDSWHQLSWFELPDGFPLKSLCLLCMLAAALHLRHHFSASASRNTARVAPQSSTHHRDPPVPSHSVACRYCWLHVLAACDNDSQGHRTCPTTLRPSTITLQDPNSPRRPRLYPTHSVTGRAASTCAVSESSSLRTFPKAAAQLMVATGQCHHKMTSKRQ
jgi:hypothetical protein